MTKILIIDDEEPIRGILKARILGVADVVDACLRPFREKGFGFEASAQQER